MGVYMQINMAKNTKKIVLITALIAMLLSFAACGGQNSISGSTIEIAGLKGATTIGMVKLMQNSEDEQYANNYNVNMFGTPDEVVPRLVSGEIPVAAIPANLASVLYNSTGGKVQVAAINTLGSLYVVEIGESVKQISDLKGKTVYSTGKGTTPQFVFNYILQENSFDLNTDITIEYLSESTEVAAKLQTEDNAVAILPQPYVAQVAAQNGQMRIALSLNDEWNKVNSDSGMVTGVLAVNAEWQKNNADLFKAFLADYENSIEWAVQNADDAADLVAKYGIVNSAEVAKEAMPYFNFDYIDGSEMKTTLSGYLSVLYNSLPEAVGGKLPDDAFYLT
jgi:NitT/TauT family transport system substrate-binding protein